MARVAVLVPAYNAARVIGESIQSILNQTYRDLEVVVVDDASTDGTTDLVEHIVAADSRLRLLRNERNLGIADNRNRALRDSESEFVAWQDADDISMPRRLERQVTYLDSHPEVGMVGGWLEFFGGRSPSVRRYAATDAEVRRTIFRYSPVAQPAAILRRAVLDRAGPYDSRSEPAEDLDMAFRLGHFTTFANLQEVVLRYRETPDSTTSRRLRRMELETLRLRQIHARSGYASRPSDWAWNIAQAGSLLLLPAPARIAVFNLIRNHRAS